MKAAQGNRPGVAALYLVALAVFLYLPFVPIGVVSLSAERYVRFPPEHWTLQWYQAIPARYVTSLLRSLLVAAVSTGLAATVGTFAAIAIHNGPGRLRRWLLAALQTPLQVPALVVGVMLLQFYAVLGRGLGLPLAESFLGLTAAHTVIGIPYLVASVFAVLQRDDRSLQEAAASLGASGWSILRRVTLPLAQPGIMAGAFYAFILSFGNVPVSLFVAGSRYEMLPIVMLHAMEFDYDPYVLSVSTYTVVLSLILVYIMDRLIGLDSLVKATSARQ